MPEPLVSPADSELPAGFQRTPGGLVIPVDTVPLEREVWTREEAAVIRRAQALCRQRGLRLIVGCQAPACAEMPLVEQEDGPGGPVWKCGHKVREMRRR